MGNRGRGPNRRGGSKAGGKTDRYQDVPTSNANFEAYYKAQQILPESEWDQFIAKLHDPLPTTFRLTSSRSIAPALNEMIRRDLVPALTGLEHEGQPLNPPKQLAWYPQGFAWQLDIAKQQVRKNPQFKRFQHFLVSETEAGNISRQEAVSMLPPLLLDVQPHHFVLDMCAAPGSKSAQLLEALCPPPKTDSGPAPSGQGLLIANDSDAKRCHLLVHQSLHRIPAAEMMVTNHDATQLPGLRLPADPADAAAANGRKYKPLLFDRVLCDVPCCGDGTLRKNIAIWREWSIGNGLGLHTLQLRILKRGIELLKPGGRLVYSTCSMNPVENEAVVSAALEANPDLSLLDMSDALPLLKRRPGLTTWNIFDSSMQPVPFPAADPQPKSGPNQKGQKKVWARTLWPNGKEKERGLERCWRLYSHVEDTGGFFVAVLVKKARDAAENEVVSEGDIAALKRTASERDASPVSEQPEAKRTKGVDAEASEDTAAVPDPEVDAAVERVDFASLPADVVGAAPRVAKPNEFKEEPFIYLSPEDETVTTCIEFFGLLPSFPTNSLLVRNASGVPQRSIYFTSSVVQQLLLGNTYTRMRLISCGTKLFARQGQDGGKDVGSYRCKWRIMNEGLSVLRPFMSDKRIVHADIATFRTLMESMNVALADIKDEKFLAKIEDMEMGSCVLEVDAQGDGIATAQHLVLPFWRSKHSVNLMVEKQEKSALSNRLWGKDVTPHAPGPSKRELRQAQAGSTDAPEESEAPGEGTKDDQATVHIAED